MGYIWNGMIKITKKEAIRRFTNDKEVYRLYDDETESLVEDVEEFENEAFGDFDFGYEVTIQ
ncbi:hypothetical protein [Lentibacillus salinarum]|uniref:Uncharacterized protein n=1 Tax=Lentibacillus salinarum TaxID=446820 RepID=A0ABW3ZZA7_9BACI